MIWLKHAAVFFLIIATVACGVAGFWCVVAREPGYALGAGMGTGLLLSLAVAATIWSTSED